MGKAIEKPSQLNAKGQLDNLSFLPQATQNINEIARPGLEGASIGFDFDLNAGSAVIQIKNGKLHFPGVWEDPTVEVENLSTELKWQLTDSPAGQHIKIDFASNSLRLLIIDTQAHHALTDGGYAKRRESCEEVAKIFSIASLRQLTMDSLLSHKSKLSDIQFKRARHGVSEMARVLDAVKALETGDFKALGQLLNQSHNSLRDDYEVSCPELDLAVDTALNSGALGARMVGGGFGGSAIALINESDAGAISLAIEKAFAQSGFKAPRFFDSLPSDGAKVIS